MSYGLGIDLGTSFTRAAIGGGGRSRMVPLNGGGILMPSVVRVQPDGTLIAGDPDVGNGDPFRTGWDFKHRLGDSTPLILGGQSLSTVSLLAATLTSVISTVTATEGGPPDRVVLTHPAAWGPGLREEFAEVPRRAGLDPAIVTLITEPEAAALHYAGRGHLSSGDVVAVLDLGGGTFDSTVIRMTGTGTEILGTSEALELVGGVNFDDVVFAHVNQAVDGAFSALDPRDLAAAIALQRTRSECLKAKERLSRDDATNIPVLLPGLHTQVRLSRIEFEALIGTTLEATLADLHRSLRSASIEPQDLTGVLLIGGSSRIPLVSRRLSADLGRPVLIDPYPQHCVALGAGAIAGRGRSGSITTAARRPLHRRPMAIAATTATALLIGTGGYVAYHQSLGNGPSNNREQGVSQSLSGSTETTPAAIPIAVATTALPSETPTLTTTPTAKATIRVTVTHRPAPPKPKTPALPIVGSVLGLEGLCLDVLNASPQNGTQIQTTTCNGTGAQVWSLRTDHTFRALGKCLDVGPAVDGGSPPGQLQDCTGALSQQWRLLDGKIVNSKSKRCLDIEGNNTADRTPTVVNPCKNDKAQKWKLAAGTVLDTTG